MSLDSMPLLQWPEGITQASVPANSNALLVQALFSRALGVENDAPGTEYNGAVYIVGDTPAGDFANFNEHDIALYEFDSWHAWSPTLGTSMVVNDVRKVFDGSAWVDDSSGGIPDAPSDGETYGRKDGDWEVIPADSGAVDSVNGQTGSVQIDAEDVPYDNAASGLAATDTQAAIDELAANPGGGMNNPMTTAGDMIVGGVSGAPTRVAIGTDGYVWTMVAGVPAWAAAGGGGGGLTNWTEAVSASTPNATVPVVSLTATNAATDVDAAIRPKGAGAFSLAIADNTAAGGNKRGSGAVDLQLSRTSADQVASGSQSFSAGRQNRASGSQSVALGITCVASGQFSFAAGSQSTASATGAFAFGDAANAGGVGAVSMGLGCVAGGAYSFATGRFSNTRGMYGARAHSSGAFSGPSGEAQHMDAVLRGESTSATPVVLSSDGASPLSATSFVLPDRSASAFKALVVVREAATGDSAAWEVAFLITRGANAASTVIVGSPIVTQIAASAGAATWGVSVVANTSRGSPDFTVTGEASHTLRWVACVSCAQQAT